MNTNGLDVTILPEDFAKAPNGYHTHADWNGQFTGCVLYWTLKRMFPEEEKVSVSASCAIIGRVGYHIDRSKWGGDGHSGEPSDFPWPKIDELSKKAKESLEGIPTVSLTLEPF